MTDFIESLPTQSRDTEDMVPPSAGPDPAALQAPSPLLQHEVGAASGEEVASPGLEASRRREKRQLSCNLCRRRKLRCDRQQPCSNCLQRQLTCTYADRPVTLSVPQRKAVMHDRIVQLERLVMSLIPGPVAGRSPNPLNLAPASRPSLMDRTTATPSEATFSAEEMQTPMDVRSECGSFHVGPSELSYVSGEHWAAILDSIADLKEHFGQPEDDELRSAQDNREPVNSEPGPPPRTLLLYGPHWPVSRSEILAALPPKGAVDRYVSRYFNRLDLVHSIVHGPTFLREYESFWADRSSVSMAWIGLLFSMICLALLASDASDTAHADPEHRSLQVHLYREKTVQCLIMGEYTKAGPYTLETLVHYIYIELNLRGDADNDIWSLFALEVNLALRMGYHRDPKHFPTISPLQAEMRRRLWATVLQGDILISSQMGMPRLISDRKSDTAEPRNLSDDDLDRTTTELPLSRPETELTPALGIIARRRMFVALGAVADLTAAVQPCTYAEVMRVDGVLQEAAASIPQPLKPKPLAMSVTDPPELIMSRLFIEHLYLNGKIMLHRRFLHVPSTSRQTDVFAYSRTACLDACLGALRIQSILDEETCPGGLLHMMRWRLSSIMNHTFLTATMVLCSALHRGQTLQRDGEILSALRKARSIWLRASSTSHEARKAAETVNLVISRIGDDGPSAQESGRLSLGQDIARLESQQGLGTSEPPPSGLRGKEIARDNDHGQDVMVETELGSGHAVFDPETFVLPGLFEAFIMPLDQN